MNIPPRNTYTHCSLPMLAVLAMCICQPVPAHARTTVDTGTPTKVVNEEMLREVYGVVARINRDESGVPMVSPIRSVQQ
ncbi:MAG: hypothetical protein RBQ88_12765 [Desulfobulbus oligotrophicus]|jgi:ABC-type cobalamin/Fe3+-siderophores transport system ATPase subunit|nr:hypothetical protein [Desulfobulbus oligotrophicus]